MYKKILYSFMQKAKIKLLIKINFIAIRIVKPCRMYKKQPKETTSNCVLCAYRGGWPRCKKSRSAELKNMSISCENVAA